ncbi:MAG TPA: 16S rRNA (adenine(1518)-N(6)/adenine(1519)-N(6))-dimethyltransferase RsmA [Clostridia bacterium]|nr:16S rRNA (adenine(1518)-N(6)/adenine(1519)-N(6))-dimethyltransferase RsmA [Clostridia bacterium]
MNNLSDLRVIKGILNRHKVKLSKSFGQNFLIDPSVCPRMADESIIDDETGVIEIGPGIGVLTVELAKRAKRVVSVELDKKLIPVLSETLKDFDNVEVLNEDILKLDLKKLIDEKFKGMKVVVCANLPYYITSPVIMHLLESELEIESITVMVQLEAAQRLTAQVGSRQAGAITVAVNYYAKSEKLFDVSRTSFYPAPKVESAVIRLEIREEPPIKIKNEIRFFRFVRAAFGQRRKTAANSLSAGLALPKDKVIDAIRRAGFDSNIRAEALSMEELAKLFEYLED